MRATPCDAAGFPRNRLAIIGKIGVEKVDHAVTLPLRRPRPLERLPRIAQAVLSTPAVPMRSCNKVAKSAALESAGVIFIDENGEGPGVRLRKAPWGTEGLGK